MVTKVSFRSIVVVCITSLIAIYFMIDSFKHYTRYDFLVSGDTCIALDRDEDSLKVISSEAVINIPLTKTLKQQMREDVEADLIKDLQTAALEEKKKQQPNLVAPTTTPEVAAPAVKEDTDSD